MDVSIPYYDQFAQEFAHSFFHPFIHSFVRFFVHKQKNKHHKHHISISETRIRSYPSFEKPSVATWRTLKENRTVWYICTLLWTLIAACAGAFSNERIKYFDYIIIPLLLSCPVAWKEVACKRQQQSNFSGI